MLQIDSVNVFERSHYLPAFSRLGAYDRDRLDRITTGRRGRMVESWAHQAAFIPRELWPLFEFRREEFRRKGSQWGGWLVENRPLGDWLRAELAANGPDAGERDRARRQRTPRVVVGLVRREAHASSGCSSSARSSASSASGSSG
ncbi:DNA glycosylase AlkZ-like family protein, partial [Agromyces flavus]|uniref:DNA glycosylase AlkZ-like family protein n=1 Tax=Agromyces flavus TaxID=589382 RepID=UPI00361B725B